MFFFLGVDGGASYYGILFHAIGTRWTLIIFASLSGVMLSVLSIYVRISDKAHEYEKLARDSVDDDGPAESDDNDHNNH